MQLGVSQPTVTDSILALECKALIEKRADPADGRAAAALGDGDQEQLLVQLVSVIRQLQEQGAIPIQHMCVSCRHFRPYAHADAVQPHHCNFVDAAFGQ